MEGTGSQLAPAQLRVRALGPDHTLINERGDNATGLTLSGTDDCCDIAAREFAAIEQRIENVVGLGWQPVKTHFLIGPRQDAGAELVRAHKPFHESHLIKADVQEEPREGRQSLFAQTAAAVKIVAAWQVARGKVALIFIEIAREPARDRPDGTGVESVV